MIQSSRLVSFFPFGEYVWVPQSDFKSTFKNKKLYYAKFVQFPGLSQKEINDTFVHFYVDHSVVCNDQESIWFYSENITKFYLELPINALYLYKNFDIEGPIAIHRLLQLTSSTNLGSFPGHRKYTFFIDNIADYDCFQITASPLCSTTTIHDFEICFDVELCQ